MVINRSDVGTNEDYPWGWDYFINRPAKTNEDVLEDFGEMWFNLT